MMRALGWKKDRPDDRDHLVSLPEPEASVSLPSSANVAEQIVDVLDQGQLGSCVANSITQCIRAAHVRQGVKNPELASRLFLYYAARAEQGDIPDDTGTENRIVLMQARAVGFPPEKVWPYNISKFTQRPPDEVFRQAYDQSKLASSTRKVPLHAMRIASTGAQRIKDMCRMLDNGFEGKGCPITFGSSVSERFCRNDLDDPMMPPVTDALAGGHDQTVIGYETAADGSIVFAVLNSWGPDFGVEAFSIRGCSWWHQSVFTWDGQRPDGQPAYPPSDLWCCEAAPYFSVIDPT